MMLTTQVYVTIAAIELASRLAATRDALKRRVDLRDEAGMTTETVIITAVLAGLAIAVTAVIVTRVTQKANSINLGIGI